MSLAVYYGGTFDPVHQGHLAVACAARDALSATVFLLPAADPPHKGPTHADADQRARMLDVAIAGERGLRVDRRELRRGGPSYTIDTLLELRAQFGPQAPLAWLVGGDSLNTLHTWHRWTELFEQAHIVAVQRPGARIDDEALARQAPEVHQAARGRWRRLDELSATPAGGLAVLPLRELRPESSSELRRRIQAGAPWRDWVPAPVAGYIEHQGLYGVATP
ncbi:nicotinate-nucleotide adenylyltransferase [Agrilutibacter solisilvae]|uniref:Probable nicotinate-nucleotide adenylyltransferase n=1 Tax=Agrilutibacter solisilvae TaxID=2763317 RepID=A0A974Y3N3_9GAMM|nr:nicotinate-nucleotide adenylyltransferase [Lysobacter solisilvae]QSX77221.1 nicotinate-nucleotide adenylyltransferase [Lysobacter solisilvae]